MDVTPINKDPKQTIKTRFTKAKQFVETNAPAITALAGSATTILVFAILANAKGERKDELKFRQKQLSEIMFADANGLEYHHFPGAGVLYRYKAPQLNEEPNQEDQQAS